MPPIRASSGLRHAKCEAEPSASRYALGAEARLIVLVYRYAGGVSCGKFG
jgi:hypothetical protein